MADDPNIYIQSLTVNALTISGTGTNYETLTAAGAISPNLKFSLLDTANSATPVAFTLAAPVTTNDTKVIRLFNAQDNAVVSMPMGTFQMNSDYPDAELYYFDGAWLPLDYRQLAIYPTTQQGAKLIGTSAVGTAQQAPVALSADGNTLAVGGPADNSNAGAVWVFTRTGTTWTQQGAKLVGTGAVGAAKQGSVVALSADGNTLAVGGPADNTNAGAVWIYTRTAGVWAQQGTKLVGTGAVGAAAQGFAVDLSGDGNTLAVGGNADNTNVGATWVFTRSGSVWTQVGSKLVGTGGTGASAQGSAVCLSSLGNTLAVGGSADNTNIGAAWVFAMTAGSWAQVGSILVGTGNAGASRQGCSVSLNASGTLLAVGGYSDNTNAGATWVYKKTNGAWAQVGSKLVGSGATGTAQQGTSVWFSASGNTLLVGGPTNNTNVGAVWTWVLNSDGSYSQNSLLVGAGETGAGLFGQVVTADDSCNTIAVGAPNDNTNIGAAFVFV